MKKSLMFLVVIGFVVVAVTPYGQTQTATEIDATIGTATLDGVASPGEWTSNSITTSRGVTIQSMIDDTNWYVLATWPDTTESVTKDQWTFDGTNWSQAGDEDRIMFIWDMGLSGSDGASCTAFCHPPDMSTNEGRVDTWHWKGTRFHPMGFLDDKYWDTTGRNSDDGGGSGDSNKNVDVPTYMAASDPGANVTFLTNDQAAQNAFDPFGVLPGTSDVKVDFDPGATFTAGDVIPGRVLKIPTGNRASVQAAGKWANGVWTVEFCRKLAGETGPDQGQEDFAALRRGSVQFTNEIFDNLADHGAHSFSPAGLSAAADFTVWTINFPPISIFFAQFGDGQGFSSDIVLANPHGTDPAAGKVEFFDNDGMPLLGLAGAHDNHVHFSIDPLDSFTYSTDGSLDPVAVGSAVVETDNTVGGVIRFNVPNIGIAGVGQSQPLSGFIAPVRRTSGGISTGVAVQNIESQSVTLGLSLRSNGIEVANGAATKALVAGGHLAEFIETLFPNADTTDFVGTLVVTVTGGQVAATALEMGSQAGEFTTLPVTALP